MHLTVFIFSALLPLLVLTAARKHDDILVNNRPATRPVVLNRAHHSGIDDDDQGDVLQDENGQNYDQCVPLQEGSGPLPDEDTPEGWRNFEPL